MKGLVSGVEVPNIRNEEGVLDHNISAYVVVTGKKVDLLIAPGSVIGGLDAKLLVAEELIGRVSSEEVLVPGKIYLIPIVERLHSVEKIYELIEDRDPFDRENLKLIVSYKQKG